MLTVRLISVKPTSSSELRISTIRTDDAHNRLVSLLEAARPPQEQCMSAGPPLSLPDNGRDDVPFWRVLLAWAIIAYECAQTFPTAEAEQCVITQRGCSLVVLGL